MINKIYQMKVLLEFNKTKFTKKFLKNKAWPLLYLFSSWFVKFIFAIQV